MIKLYGFGNYVIIYLSYERKEQLIKRFLLSCPAMVYSGNFLSGSEKQLTYRLEAQI